MLRHDYHHATARTAFKAGLAGIAIAALIANTEEVEAAGLYSQTYPGTNCVQEYAGLTIITPSITYSFQAAENSSVDAKIFICPIDSPPVIYDGISITAPIKGYWTANVADGNSTRNVRCRLISYEPGAINPSYSGPFREAAGTGRQVLSTSGIVEEFGGYTRAMFLRCDMPGRVGVAKSSILNYSIWAWE